MHSPQHLRPQNLPRYQQPQLVPTWANLQQYQRLWRETNQSPKVIRHAAPQRPVHLSRYQTRWERLDNTELGLENLGNWAFIAALDEIQPHQITLKSRVILDCRTLMSSQYLTGTEGPDSAHSIHEDLVQTIPGNMQRVKGLIHCGATSIFISPSLLWKLTLPHDPGFTSTQGLDVQVMMSANESQKASLLVQYFVHH